MQRRTLWLVFVSALTLSACSTPPTGFNINLNPSSLSIPAGQSNTATLGVSLNSSETRTISISLVGAPAGVSVAPTMITVNGSATTTLTFSVGSGVAYGNYSFKLRATLTPNNFQETPVSLTVGSGNSGGGDNGGGGGNNGGGGGNNGGGSADAIRVIDYSTGPTVQGVRYRIDGGSWYELAMSNRQGSFTAANNQAYEIVIRCPNNVEIIKATPAQQREVGVACMPVFVNRNLEVTLPSSIGEYNLASGDIVAATLWNNTGEYDGSNPVSLSITLPGTSGTLLLSVFRPTNDPNNPLEPIGYKEVQLEGPGDAPLAVDASGWQPFSSVATLPSVSAPANHTLTSAVLYFRPGYLDLGVVGGYSRYGLHHQDGNYVGFAVLSMDNSTDLRRHIKTLSSNNWIPDFPAPWEATGVQLTNRALTLQHPEAAAYQATFYHAIEDMSGVPLLLNITLFGAGPVSYEVSAIPELGYRFRAETLGNGTFSAYKRAVGLLASANPYANLDLSTAVTHR